ncbi:hypothetical protein VKT23_016385 [Stygiomarasmius scandens]|uniref:ENTH domain-containing protein n=1 Tax=Marasmiellus scandens TaxID=2682957 RepID=A0ABR1IZ58_9AGAR
MHLAQNTRPDLDALKARRQEIQATLGEEHLLSVLAVGNFVANDVEPVVEDNLRRFELGTDIRVQERTDLLRKRSCCPPLSTMQSVAKGGLRVIKNYTKGYSDTQAKVRDATSNDPWGPSGTQMNEIAQLTYNQGDFVEIMEMLDKRLNDKGKNWRHVFKSLTVLDYCLHQGSENVVIYFRDNIYIIKTLKEFQYVDEEGKDQGANVRQKAKDITNLLQDEARLRHERRTRAHMRDRMIRGAAATDDDGEPDDENARRRQLNGSKRNKDDDDLRRAIEESKKTLAQERLTAEDRDLQEAIKLSQEEEDKRNKAVEDSNAASLFDDNNQLAANNSQFNNNPFPTMSMSDPTPYTVGLQPQFTSFNPMQPQFTSFNPYQQQMQQEAAQAEYMRQQELFQQQQQQLQQQQQQEEWMRQQMMLQQQQQQQQQQMFLAQQQPIMAQPTGFGSNNPFAQQQQSPISPTDNQRQPPSFNLQGTYDNNPTNNLHNLSSPSSFSQSPSPGPSQNQQPGRPMQVRTRENENKELANLFADRDGGQDTFGNTGVLRFGHTNAGRMVTQNTGMPSHNPFAMQQQQQQAQGGDQPFFSI